MCRAFVGAMFALATLPAATAAYAQPVLDAGLARRLSSGEIVVDVTALPDGTGGRIVAVLDIAASPRRLWDVMLDCRHSMRIVDSLKSCKVTSADPNGKWDVRQHLVQWAWPLPNVRSVFRSDYVPFESIRFRKTDGDLKALTGAWHLQSLAADRMTRLHYDAVVDPGVPLPGVLVRTAIEADVRKTLAALRREASGHDRR